MKKHEVVELLKQFREDEDVDTEKLIETLYLKAKLDRAEEALARGDTLTHQQLVEESKSWFK